MLVGLLPSIETVNVCELVAGGVIPKNATDVPDTQGSIQFRERERYLAKWVTVKYHGQLANSITWRDMSGSIEPRIEGIYAPILRTKSKGVCTGVIYDD